MNTIYPVLTSKQVRAAEVEWAQQQQCDTYVLMQRAAVSFVRQFADQLKGESVIVFVGPGNNGGDGYLIAKHLVEQGEKVQLIAPFGLPKPELDAHRAMLAFTQSGGEILTRLPNAESVADIAIDALFGSGLSRPLTDEACQLIGLINRQYRHVLSVDVPSGLNADSGLALPLAIRAQATHSFIALKPGLLTGDGPSYYGTLSLDSLQVSIASAPAWHWQTSITDLPKRAGNTHKSQHGQVRVISGQPSMPGAAIIAARAALQAGAGKVFVDGERAALLPFLAVTPELMLSSESVSQKEIVVIGPGLGRSAAAKDNFLAVLAQAEHGVLDADALYWLAQDPSLDVCHWVLTPHEGEAAALLGCPAEQVRLDRPKAALALAKKFNTVVVLKGAGSLVAFRGRLTFCHAGSPAMASPGMGDCLAGIIAALLAQGLATEQAAILAVNWHARIGAWLAKRQRLVLASDIVSCLSLNSEQLDS